MRRKSVSEEIFKMFRIAMTGCYEDRVAPLGWWDSLRDEMIRWEKSKRRIES